MAKVAKKALEEAGITPDELGALIPHQANARIIDQMVKTLKLPDTVAVARDIVDAGNTSAASVPLAAHRLLKENPDFPVSSPCRLASARVLPSQLRSSFFRNGPSRIHADPHTLRVVTCVHSAYTINSVMHAYPRPVGATTIEITKEPLNG